jgi:hypothetical protein
MSYPGSGSSLGAQTNVGLSTQIVVKVNNTTVGAIQSLVAKQDRKMKVVEEIGTDGIIEIHPMESAKISLTVSRIVFDSLRLPEAFGRGFINIQSQRLPFDICVLDRSTVSDLGLKGKSKDVMDFANRWANNITEWGSKLGIGIKATEPYMGHIVHTYNNCWITNYTTNYKSETFLIIEEANIVCEYVTSMTDGKNVADGGKRGIQYDYDTIERVTDLTGNRGKFYAVVDDRGFGKKLVDAIF